MLSLNLFDSLIHSLESFLTLFLVNFITSDFILLVSLLICGVYYRILFVLY